MYSKITQRQIHIFHNVSCNYKIFNIKFVPKKKNQRLSPIIKSSKNVNGMNSESRKEEDGNIWSEISIPQYLQNDDRDFCKEWESAFPENERISDSNNKDQYTKVIRKGQLVWNAIRREAETDAKSEPLLSSFLYASILAHTSFDRALAFVLANRLSTPTMLSTQLFEIFSEIYATNPKVLECAFADIDAVRERDPACTSYSSALLYYKGYHAIQVHRIAHALWNNNQKIMALNLQSRVSEAFAVDIHPAAVIGKGILIDHGTGVVIGETVVIGNNVSILQNVTLGGTGKEVGDRHPKIGNNVLIGASATILGNIMIGKGSQVAAGSLVLKPVPPHIMVAGSPAKEIGRVSGNPAFSMVHWVKKEEICNDLFKKNNIDKEQIIKKEISIKKDESNDVEATQDDELASAKWPNPEDPEYAI